MKAFVNVFIGVVSTLLVVISFFWLKGINPFDSTSEVIEETSSTVLTSDALFDEYMMDRDLYDLSNIWYSMPVAIVDAIILEITETYTPEEFNKLPKLTQLHIFNLEYSRNKAAYLELVIADRMGEIQLSEKENELIDSIKVNVIPRETKSDSIIKKTE